MNEIMTMRTDLANQFAAAGAELLHFTLTAGALAAIPNTAPQQYAVAGTLESIRAVLPNDEPGPPQRRQRKGDRPTEPLSFEDEADSRATAPHAGPTDEQIEVAAKAIYEHLPADRTGDSKTYPWQPGGNSFKQDEARRYARAALSATHPSETVGGAAPTDAEKYSAGATAMIGSKMPCGAIVTNVYEAYQAGQRAAAPAWGKDLLAALRKYGTHLHTCECVDGGEIDPSLEEYCDCGLNAILEAKSDRAAVAAAKVSANAVPTTDLSHLMSTSIRDYPDFTEDVLRLSEPGLSRKQAKIIRKAIYDTIDARVRNSIIAAQVECERATAPVEQGQGAGSEAVKFADTDEARKFVDQWHRQHFPTDRTFSRYIMGRDRSCALAGDFAWQLANALAAGRDQGAGAGPVGGAKIPDVIFDGFSVYAEMDQKAHSRTSADNVSDVLDAVARLMRKAARPVGGALVAKGGQQDQVLRDMLAIQEACGLHTDEYAPGSVIEYIKELEAAESAAAPADLTQAARDVLAERRRQIEQEGWTPAHDDQYKRGDLSQAAACYALHTEPVGNVGDYLRFWPWPATWWKPRDNRSNLVKSGALILAEIERLDRATKPATQEEGKHGD